MTTREVLNVQKDYGEHLCLFRPNFSDWELVDQKEPKDGKEAIYQLMDGDPLYPATIRIGAYEKADGSKSFSVRFSTWVKITDDNDVISYKKKEYVVATNTDAGVHTGESYDHCAIGNVLIFGGFISPLATPALGAGVSVDQTILNRRKFGIPSFDPSDVDDPAES